jgi:hypothetical protein
MTVDISIHRPAVAVTRKAPREPINSQNSLRVYNYAPGLIMVQIRGTNSYHSITLPLDDAEQLRTTLDLAIKDATR